MLKESTGLSKLHSRNGLAGKPFHSSIFWTTNMTRYVAMGRVHDPLTSEVVKLSSYFFILFQYS